MKGCIVSAAEAVVRGDKKKQPDCFIEAADTLQALLRAKQQAHKEVLHTNKTANRKEFRRHQRIVNCIEHDDSCDSVLREALRRVL